MKYIFYDLETTGLDVYTARIVEICAYEPVTKNLFYMRVKPDIPIPLESSNIHQIFDKDVEDCPSIEEVLVKFINFCGKDNICLVAHNNDGYDKLVLKSRAKFQNINLPKWKYMDTLHIVRELYPHLPRHTLTYLKEHFGIEQGRAHCARDDVLSMYALYEKIKEDRTDKELYKMSKEHMMTTMPFGKHKGQLLSDIPDSYVKWMDKKILKHFSNRRLRKSLEKLGRI